MAKRLQSRRQRGPCGIIQATALCDLCRYRHKSHWTSAATRCNRQLGKRFGDQAYAMEEPVAELGAAFLCADLGITNVPREDHAQYLATWLSVLKADKKAIFTAASKASEAAGFLAAFQGAWSHHLGQISRRGCEDAKSPALPSRSGLALGKALDPADESAVRLVRRDLAPAPFAILGQQRLPVPSRRDRVRLGQHRVAGLIIRASRSRRCGEASRASRLPLQDSVAIVARRGLAQRELDFREGFAFAEALIPHEESALFAVLVDFIDVFAGQTLVSAAA